MRIIREISRGLKCWPEATEPVFVVLMLELVVVGVFVVPALESVVVGVFVVPTLE